MMVIENRYISSEIFMLTNKCNPKGKECENTPIYHFSGNDFRSLLDADSCRSTPRHIKNCAQILRGGDGTAEEDEGAGVGINLFSYFSSSCYTG